MKLLRTLCTALNVSSYSILFPDSEKNSLSGEQYSLLLEIASRYIEAVTLREP